MVRLEKKLRTGTPANPPNRNPTQPNATLIAKAFFGRLAELDLVDWWASLLFPRNWFCGLSCVRGRSRPHVLYRALSGQGRGTGRFLPQHRGRRYLAFPPAGRRPAGVERGHGLLRVPPRGRRRVQPWEIPGKFPEAEREGDFGALIGRSAYTKVTGALRGAERDGAPASMFSTRLSLCHHSTLTT